MTPKEKAEEIVSKYTNMFTVFIPAKNTIKQCALIAVDELVGLERNISSLDVKKSDYNSWRAIKTSLSSLIETYKKLR